jgi:hypothetical protein
LRDNKFDGLDVYEIKIDTFGGRNSFYQIFSQNLIANLKNWRTLKELMRVKVKNSEQLLKYIICNGLLLLYFIIISEMYKFFYFKL